MIKTWLVGLFPILLDDHHPIFTGIPMVHLGVSLEHLHLAGATKEQEHIYVQLILHFWWINYWENRKTPLYNIFICLKQTINQ